MDGRVRHLCVSGSSSPADLLLDIAHGGFVVTLMDESIGMLLQLNIALKKQKGVHPITGENAFTACTFCARLTRGMRSSRKGC